MSNNKALENLFLQFCHDIAGPIGTISNVSELMEYDAQCKQEYTKMHELLQNSSAKAVLLLQLYRDIIFRNGENLDYIEFKELIAEYTSVHGIVAEFRADTSISELIPKQVAIPTILILMKACADIAKKNAIKNKSNKNYAPYSKKPKIILAFTAESCTIIAAKDFCNQMQQSITKISNQISLDFSNIKLLEPQTT